MDKYGRAIRGAEAGVIAAIALELSFFVLDLVRLSPLATPVALSGVVPGYRGIVVDLTSLEGLVNVLWAVYQIGMLTVVHFLTFGLVGILVSLLFDWSQPLEAKRLLMLAILCTAAFFATVGISSSMLALESVGWTATLATNLLAAVVLGGSLRLVSMTEPSEETFEEAA